MSKEILRNEILQQKLLLAMEVLMPPLIHMLNLSIVEIVIHGQIFYSVLSDFASVLFMMSLAMIFQMVRKKVAHELTKVPMRMFFVTLLSVFVCDLALRIIYLPLQYIFFFSIIDGHLASVCENYLFFLKFFDRWINFSKFTVALREPTSYSHLRTAFSIFTFGATLKWTKCFGIDDFKEFFQSFACVPQNCGPAQKTLSKDSDSEYSDS